MKCIFVFFALAVVVLQSEGKIFSRCELVRELRAQGFPEDKLRDWVCLVEAESRSDTSAIHVNDNGSRDYGLFQINDGYWCSRTSTPGMDCNVTCADLLTDDITKASKCAKLVYKRQGFKAWYEWRRQCQGTLPNISSCKN